MKCRYHFKVTSELAITNLAVELSDGLTYEFVKEDILLSGVIVTVHHIEPPDFPAFATEGKTASVRMNFPSMDKVEASLRTIEGILSLYGNISLDFEHPKLEWVPETPEEREAINVEFMEMGHESEIGHLAVPNELLTEITRNVELFSHLEIPLTFYRRGRRALVKRRYIEAVYEFYFFLEALFANGKTKNSHVENEFKRSTELKAAIEKAIPSTKLPQGEQALEHRFNEKYRAASFEAIIHHLVSLRGQLHHYTLIGPNKWHPENSARYKADAYALTSISTEIAANRCFKSGPLGLVPSAARLKVKAPAATIRLQLRAQQPKL